jgi:hypothetical protein
MNALMLRAAIVAGTLSLAFVAGAATAPAAAASAAGPVRVTTTLPFGDVGDLGGTSALMALYVDSAGAAHVAWVASDDESIDLCTIPAGGAGCIDQSTISTAPPNGSDGIGSIKYLPNDSGGPTYLAVGIEDIDPPPAIDRFGSDPGTEEELFALGQTTGLATGEVSVPSGGGGSGDVILEPDGSGVDVAGESQYGPPDYEFESLVAGGTDSAVVPLAGQSQRLIDVTKLPQGQTAVLADPTDISPETTPIGMFVQSVDGGPFGPLRSLGISGPSAATSSSGASYVLNVETGSNSNVDGLPAAPMELYRFRGMSLVPVASVGAAIADINAHDWSDLPPVFEDASGDFYTAWDTQPGFDGCNPPDLHVCLMYRRIGAGGLLGPKIVLATPSDEQEELGPIAVNANGVGWLLTVKETLDNSTVAELDASRLPSSAAAGTPTVRASAVHVPVSCGGAPSTRCTLSATLTRPGSAKASSAVAAAATVFAHLTRKLSGGHRTTLVLRLDRAGKKLLTRRHRLTASLLVTQTVGAVKTPTTVISKRVSFTTRKR